LEEEGGVHRHKKERVKGKENEREKQEEEEEKGRERKIRTSCGAERPKLFLALTRRYF